MSWEKYYDKNNGRPLRPLYLQSIELISDLASVASDLGCGVGCEAIDLLKRGYKVHAVDQEQKSIDIVKALAAENSNLQTYVAELEKWQDWPKVDFLFAYHSLPFCRENYFKSVVQKSIACVNKNGIFAASFFGPEDDWVLEKRATGITADQIKEMLTEFSILHFEEIEKMGPTALGGEKMWHVFELIARRD